MLLVAFQHVQDSLVVIDAGIIDAIDPRAVYRPLCLGEPLFGQVLETQPLVEHGGHGQYKQLVFIQRAFLDRADGEFHCIPGRLNFALLGQHHPPLEMVVTLEALGQ